MFNISLDHINKNQIKLNQSGQLFLTNLLDSKGVGICIHDLVFNQHGFVTNYRVVKANECYLKALQLNQFEFEGNEVLKSELKIGYPWIELYRRILDKQQAMENCYQEQLEIAGWNIAFYFDTDYLIITISEKSEPDLLVASSPVQISARIFGHNHFILCFDRDLFIRFVSFKEQTGFDKEITKIIGNPLQKLPGFNHPSVIEILKKAINGHTQQFKVNFANKIFDCVTLPMLDALGQIEMVAIEGNIETWSDERIEETTIKNAIIDYSLTGLFLTDQTGKLTYVNKALNEMWYIKNDTELLGHDIIGLWADKEAFRMIYEQLIIAGNCTNRIMAKRKNGSEFWVKFNARLIQNTNNQIIGISGSVVDITPEIEAKSQSEISMNNFKRFYNTIPDFLVVFDDNYKILDINNYVTAYLGYSKSEIDHLPVYNLYKNISEKRFQKILEDLFSLKKDFCSCKLIGKDNQEIAVETSVFKGLWNDQPAFYCINKDVSELQQSEEKFTKAFHTSPAIVSLTELDTNKFIGINEIFTKKLGYSFEEVIGFSAIEIGLISKEDRDQLVHRLRQGEKISELKLMFRKKTGEALISLVSADILTFQGKKYLYLVAQDITLLHQLELMQSHIVQLYRKMDRLDEKELIDLAFYSASTILECKGSFVCFCNNHINERIIWHKGEEKGGKVCELQPDSTFLKKELQNIIANQKPYFSSEKIPTHDLIQCFNNSSTIDGMIGIPMIESQQVVFIAGAIDKKTGFTTDDLNIVETISENLWNIIRMKRAEHALIESENQLKEAQQIAHLGIWEYDVKTGLINLSDELERIFGLQPSTKAIPLHRFMNFIVPGERKYIERKIVESMNHPEPVEVEHQIVLDDGTIKHINQKFSTRFNEKGVPNKVIGTFLDVSSQRMVQDELLATNRKLMEITQELRENQLKLETRNSEYQAMNKAMKRNLERISQINIELNAAKDKAEESNRLKTAFLQNLSHEVRTPMNGIVGFASMLSLPNLTDEKRKYFTDIIVSSTDQLLNIINDILDFSRIEAGQVEIKMSCFNIYELLDDIKLQYEFEAQNKGLELTLQVSDDERHVSINSDPDKIKKIWGCLLNNALKFTHNGSIVFGYALKPGQVEFFIRDTGIGIAPENHQVIFERFRQVEEAFSRNYGGNGLGLSICKGYCQLLGGNIWVDSKLGEGSLFRFTIPLTDEHNVNQQYKNQNDHILANKIILIVEDELLNFLYLDEVLTGMDIQTLHAKNGVEAIEMYKQNPKIDMVLMDIKMPEMNGIEATQILKSMNKNLPVIIQTAYAVEQERQNAFEAGCDAFMSKPLRKNELLACMHEIIQKKLLT